MFVVYRKELEVDLLVKIREKLINELFCVALIKSNR